LTGSVRTLVDAFPTLLDLFNSTPGGFDVYAALSVSKGGKTDADRDAERDYAGLEWLKAVRDGRMTLQLLAFDDHSPSDAFSPDVLRVFPSAEAYPWTYPNGRAELLNIWKQSIAQNALDAHCASLPRHMMSSLGPHCYDMVVRARSDLFFSFGLLERLPSTSKHLGPPFDVVRKFSSTFFVNGINLNVYWDAWNRSMLLSTTLPTELLGTVKRVDTWSPGPLDNAACINSAPIPLGSASTFDFLPLFSPAHGNDWGGPNDSILWGPFDTMRLYFSRALTLEKGLFKRIMFHPETLVKCGIMEALRLSQPAPEQGVAMRPVAIEHIMISLGYCRQKRADLVHCVAEDDLPNQRVLSQYILNDDDDAAAAAGLASLRSALTEADATAASLSAEQKAVAESVRSLHAERLALERRLRQSTAAAGVGNGAGFASMGVADAAQSLASSAASSVREAEVGGEAAVVSDEREAWQARVEEA